MDLIRQLVGVHWGVFLGLTLILFGFAAFMTGQGVARGWKPSWQVFAFAPLLGAGNRFLDWALFKAPLWMPSGFLVETAWAALVAYAAHRMTTARMMVRQYPWIYEPAGPFGWRERT